jgi:hypothetical protein
MDVVFFALATFIGVQIGESRVRREWDEERLRNSVVQAKQEQHADEVHRSQYLINQQISNELTQKSQILASHSPFVNERRMCSPESFGAVNMSSVPQTSPRAEPPTANDLSPASRDTEAITCPRLAQDAAQTTLMLIELQSWFELQSQAFR